MVSLLPKGAIVLSDFITMLSADGESYGTGMFANDCPINLFPTQNTERASLPPNEQIEASRAEQGAPFS